MEKKIESRAVKPDALWFNLQRQFPVMKSRQQQHKHTHTYSLYIHIHSLYIHVDDIYGYTVLDKQTDSSPDSDYFVNYDGNEFANQNVHIARSSSGDYR